MALDKAIKSGKEHRKAYRGSKAFDSTCRNHGSCGCVRSKAAYKAARQAPMVDINTYK